MKNKSVLILGALSDIAKSIAQKYGENGYNLHLAARKIDDLELHSTDLKIRYNVNVNIYEFDLLKTESHKDFIRNLKEILLIQGQTFATKVSWLYSIAR